MRVFVTGATGFVGSAVTRELLAHGHEVLGLARTEQRAAALASMGAQAHLGALEQPDSLDAGARACDAVVHTGFLHDFLRFAQACTLDRIAIETLGAAIAGTHKPLIVTAGLASLDACGAVATESDPALPPSQTYPRASEAAASALSAQGIPTSVMRLPPSVHGQGDHGFVPLLIDLARTKGVSAHIGAGNNGWPAVHVKDAARAYRLAVERGPAADTYHAVAEETLPFRQIAEAIALGLSLPCVSLAPEEARTHFGWFFPFAAIDQPASSAQTRARLGWSPTGPGLLSDVRSAGYFSDVGH
ncbi:MAG: SDR family oxidoreductase [Pseudomonadota bacterium]